MDGREKSMEEIDIHAKLAQIETAPHFSMIFEGDTDLWHYYNIQHTQSGFFR